MVSFLHYWALDNFIGLARYLGKEEDAVCYEAVAEKVRRTCDEVLWDKEWYIRGITKKGRKIGTFEDKEGRVHLESNAWAVLSGAAKGERALKAMEAIEKYLYTPYGLLLNTPAYTKPDPDIGFITKVYPGLKENSSIFSHPNPWVWAAECLLGRGDVAMKYYDALCPYNQNDIIEIREAEPYSYCQFISGKEHSRFGQAHHPFMTGSGGWAYFSALVELLERSKRIMGSSSLIYSKGLTVYGKVYHISQHLQRENLSGGGAAVKRFRFMLTLESKSECL